MTWYRTIQSDLFTNPTHREMGSAIWLFGLLIMKADRSTGIKNHKVKDLAHDIQCSNKQVGRWIHKLKDLGKIQTRRLSAGYCFMILNWPKIIHLARQNCPDGMDSRSDRNGPPTGQECPPDWTKLSDTSETFNFVNTEKQIESLKRSDRIVLTNNSLFQQSFNNTPPNPPRWNEDFKIQKSGSDAKANWKMVLARIAEDPEMLPENYKKWFGPTVGLIVNPQSLVVEVPNRFYQRCLEENYLGLIRSSINQVLGFNPGTVKFKVSVGWGESQVAKFV